MDLSHEDHVFKTGDRGYSHYVCGWGTVAEEPDDQGWFDVRFDDHGKVYMNAVRFVTPEVATRYGYGTDPTA